MSHLPISTEVTVTFFYNSDFIKEDSCRSANGEFTASLSKIGWYHISLSASGYLELSDTLWIMTTDRAPIERSYYFSPRNLSTKAIASKESLRLESEQTGSSIIPKPHPRAEDNNPSLSVYFPFGKSSLTESTKPVLNNVASFLKRYDAIILEINGHTDNNGPDDYNMMLSQWRAQTVVNYLVAQGVNSSQIVSHGYGESRQINHNLTIEDRSKNRRVDLTLLNSPIDITKSNSQTSTK